MPRRPRKQRRLLDGLYEHSPWIARAALAHRPFKSLAHLKHAMARIVSEAGREAQLALIRAHPELAGKAMVSNQLTAESTNEQSKAGLAELHAGRVREDPAASTPTTTPGSVSRSSWRCAGRAAPV